MNTQFCKVGKVKFSLNEVLNLNEVENNYFRFSEEMRRMIQADSSLVDFLSIEANKLKAVLLNLKNSKTTDPDAAL